MKLLNYLVEKGPESSGSSPTSSAPHFTITLIVVDGGVCLHDNADWGTLQAKAQLQQLQLSI